MLEHSKTNCHAARAGTNTPETPVKPDYSENIDTENLTFLGAPTFKESPEEKLAQFPRNEDFTHYEVKHVEPVFNAEVTLFSSCSDVAEAQMRHLYKTKGIDVFQVSLTRSGIEAGKGYFCYPRLLWTCQVSERGNIHWLPLLSNPADKKAAGVSA